MGKVADKTGFKFGMLTVIKQAGFTDDGKAKWLCRCDCGNYKVIRSCNIRENSKTKSCGCYKREYLKRTKHSYKHGMYGTRIYNEWASMKWRCYTKSNTSYKNYGGRGIRVCEEWLNDFLSFYTWAIENGYSDELTLDRIDVDGNYEPDNCRWVSMKVQDNNKRNNKYLEYNGEIHSCAEWSENIGAKDRHTVSDRIAKGWSVEKAVTTPVRRKSKE